VINAIDYTLVDYNERCLESSYDKALKSDCMQLPICMIQRYLRAKLILLNCFCVKSAFFHATPFVFDLLFSCSRLLCAYAEKCSVKKLAYARTRSAPWELRLLSSGFTEAVFTHTEDVFLLTEDDFIHTEAVFIRKLYNKHRSCIQANTEDVFLLTEAEFIDTEDVFLLTEAVFIHTEDVSLLTEAVFIRRLYS
jgi:hypothetical protein